MYHERQWWSLCGIHAINNLLQQPVCDKAYYDSICDELSPSSSFVLLHVNPHRSILGIGNYDVNVLMMVLQRHGLQVKWHDARQPVTPELLLLSLLEDSNRNIIRDSPKEKAKKEMDTNEKCQVYDNDNNQDNNSDNNSKDTTGHKNIVGIVVNLPSDHWWARHITHGRHWFTLLWMADQQQWVNLDSNLKEPRVIGTMTACAQQLQEWQQLCHESCHILLVTS